MDIEISVATGTGQGVSIRDIDEAVRASEHLPQLRDWVRSKTRLGLHVQFYLDYSAAADADVADLLAQVAAALVQGLHAGATGEVFWQIIGSKRVAQQRRVVLRIVPL